MLRVILEVVQACPHFPFHRFHLFSIFISRSVLFFCSVLYIFHMCFCVLLSIPIITYGSGSNPTAVEKKPDSRCDLWMTAVRRLKPVKGYLSDFYNFCLSYKRAIKHNHFFEEPILYNFNFSDTASLVFFLPSSAKLQLQLG